MNRNRGAILTVVLSAIGAVAFLAVTVGFVAAAFDDGSFLSGLIQVLVFGLVVILGTGTVVARWASRSTPHASIALATAIACIVLGGIGSQAGLGFLIAVGLAVPWVFALYAASGRMPDSTG